MRGHYLSRSEIIRSALHFFLDNKQIISLNYNGIIIDKKGKIWKKKTK